MWSTKALTLTAAAILVLGSRAADQPSDWPQEREGTATAGDLTVFREAALPAASGAVRTHRAADVSAESLTEVVARYCQACHNNQLLTGNLSLEGFDVAAVAETLEDTETAEKMIVKLRAAMMPPPGMPSPGGDTLLALVETLEDLIDRAAEDEPNPGARTFQRLNRAEYQRAIRDLLGLDVDAGAWLPNDQLSSNFDNIADVQSLSPTLMEAYLNAANEIARLAVGDASAPPAPKTYSNSILVSQNSWDHVEGAPYGTRGGIVVEHQFPADGEYTFSMEFQSGNNSREQDIDISIDGQRVALVPYGGRIDFNGDRRVPIETNPIFIRAGQHTLSAAFIRRLDGPYEDLMRPHDWSLAGMGLSGYGTTMLPHIKHLTVTGPFNATGISETATRERIFRCRPSSAADEGPCAEEILGRLGSDAYRRPLEAEEVVGLMRFYDLGSEEGGLEIGIRTALVALLASPKFVFRFEERPSDVRAGEVFPLSDLDLASRLSFFLWGTIPDDELLAVARAGRLSNERVLEEQTRRMLADPHSEALSTRFASQWFRLQDLDKVMPDAFWFPNYSQQLADAMRQETELFFHDLVRRDGSVFDLYTADYTFMNERLAEHYGIPGVVGEDFQRVTYPEVNRRGLLGHGSILVLTSLANRTSPVLRGKWVMEVLLNTPPPPPPPGVPALEETEGTKDGRFLTTRERMEMHRTNAVCRSCHQYMDPIGLALDNFDVTGKWRIRENGMPLDTRGRLYDGTDIASPQELSDALLARPIPLLRTFTVNLMAYALGRRVETYDQPTVRRIVREAEENDYRMSSFILGVVKSDAFRMKKAEAAAVDTETRQ